MDRADKGFFTRLKNSDSYFNDVIKKITINNNLDDNEYAYILNLSMLFLQEYYVTKRDSYFEFSYYLVLNYSLKTHDFNPLLDFSFNNGFYPIAKSILSNRENNISDIFLLEGLKKYTNESNNIVELKQQKEKINNLINSKNLYRAYIAPTSFGKSSFIVDDINKQNFNKVGIIVPKKALIWQTYRNIIDIAKDKKYKVLLFDTEYHNEERFIGIFTQERAIRLLQDNDTAFDVLYIDEAHNLFKKDERNVLLARVIKLNKKLNPNCKIIYLSPLINDVDNMKFDKTDNIDIQKIDFNIKELDIGYYDETLHYKKYNRYVNSFYEIETNYVNCFDYIIKNSNSKNLIYLNKPKDIEKFASIFASKINDINDDELTRLSNIIGKHVHMDYKMCSLIKKGVIYIHSKIPEIIKDYLIEQFKTCNSIKYIISNSSIFEGINLPIDRLFIVDAFRLNTNDLFNLVGRVNRLNEIFCNPPKLNKLICFVDFVHVKNYTHTDLSNKINELRSNITDDVENPLLVSSVMDYKKQKVRDLENNFINDYKNKSLKSILIKNNVNYFYKNIDKAVDIIDKNIKSLTYKIEYDNLIKGISNIFLKMQDEIIDYEISRLIWENTQNFYQKYINKYYFSDISTKISYFMSYMDYYDEHGHPFYIGESFGEETYQSTQINTNKKVYIRIKDKDYKTRINIAVIKTLIEDNLISFKLTKFVKTLFDLKLIDEKTYNMFMYNSNDDKLIFLLNSGVNYQLANFIVNNKLEDDIKVTSTGYTVTEKFKDFILQQDDLIKFELTKILQQ